MVGTKHVRYVVRDVCSVGSTRSRLPSIILAKLEILGSLNVARLVTMAYQDRALMDENLRLREENARLKTENRRLHDELAESARSNETLLTTNRRLQERLRMRPSAQMGGLDSRVLAAFRQFDRNGSGQLDYKELRSALEALGVDCTTSEAVQVVQAYDQDGNGLLDVYEFAGLAEKLGLSMGRPSMGGGGAMVPAQRYGGQLDQRVVAAFRQFDRNGSGQLDYRELRNALNALGIDCTAGEAVQVLQAYDRDGNGLLDVYEFMGLAQRLGLSMGRPSMGGAMVPASRLPAPGYGGGYGGMSGGRLDQRVMNAFRQFDRNGSGQLDHRELRNALNALGVDCTTGEAVQVLQAYDRDGNGLLDINEFASLAQRLGLSMGGMDGMGGGMGMMGGMGMGSPYGGGMYGGMGMGMGMGSPGFGGAYGTMRGGRIGRYGMYDANSSDMYGEEGMNSLYGVQGTAWRRLPKNVAHWTCADVVCWLVMIDEIAFIETFVRRQITGISLLSLHLSNDDWGDGLEVDKSPSDLRAIMRSQGIDVEELRMRALVEHVARLRKYHRRARAENDVAAVGGGDGGLKGGQLDMYTSGLGGDMYGVDEDEVVEAVTRRNRGWTVENEYAAWRKVFKFQADRALHEQHKFGTRKWIWGYNLGIMMLSGIATVLGAVMLGVFPNDDDEGEFAKTDVGSLRWSWNLAVTLVTLTSTALSTALQRYTPIADRTTQQCDEVTVHLDKLILMYLKTLRAPVAKRQEFQDFTQTSDQIEAEHVIQPLSSQDFFNAASRVRIYNAPLWRTHFRYCAVEETDPSKCSAAACRAVCLPARFTSFEFPPSRVVGICLVYKLSEESLGRHLESIEQGLGARRAFDTWFSRELLQQPILKLPGRYDTFVDPFCEPLRGLLVLDETARGMPGARPQLSNTLCNQVLDLYVDSKRGRIVKQAAQDAGYSGAASRQSPMPMSARFAASPAARRSQTADVPVPASYAV